MSAPQLLADPYVVFVCLGILGAGWILFGRGPRE